jgi:hypothetical protein
MAMKVSCPNCLSLLQVPRKLRGKVVVCPCCKEKCRVPLPSTVGVSPAGVIVRDEVAADAQARAYDPARGSWIRMAVVASIAAAVVAVGGLILSAAVDFGRPARTQQGTDGNGAGPEQQAPPGDARPLAIATGGNSDGLAVQAEKVLRTHCYRCHGQDGVAEGGFNFVLRRERLVSDNKYIKPSQPGESYLLSRITDEEMPPAGESRPSKDEIDILRRWIVAGAPDFALPLDRKFLSNADLVSFIRKDLEEVPSRLRQHTRYFTLVNLYNAGFSDDEMETYRLALSKLVNSLSWFKKVVPPRPIDPHGTIFRVDIRDLGWDEKVWQAIIEANPYSVKMDGDDLDSSFCLSQTQCEIPHVRGDWFVAAASRPPLYHTVLQVPPTLKELLEKHFPNLDLQKDIKQESVVRVGFGRSGVSAHNRMLEWHPSRNGYFWISYDFGGDTDRKNLFRHPMGPGTGAEDFEHDGGEIIFSLPNGLQGYMLVDAEGKRIDKGPINIVSDPRRTDRTVTNGVSCMSCHYAGIIRKDDEIRKNVEANPKSFRDNSAEILALYKPKEEVDGLYQENIAQFREAMKQVGIIELTETGEPIVNMAQRFETEVDARTAAAELGMELEKFLDSIRNNPRVADRLGPLNIPGGTVKRDLFAKEFTFVVEELRLGKALKQPAATASAAVSAPVDKPVETPKPATPPPAEEKKPVAGTDSPPEKAPTDLPPGEKPPEIPPPGKATPKVAKPPQPGPPVAAAPVRTWRNLSPLAPKNKVDASFVSLIKGEIRLSLGKGITILWPMQDLSPEDHEYVKQLVGPDHYEKHKDLPFY